jgi:6-pyruvoyltetrahydropterin/6-carboxytetrahydropterin synthase
MSKYKSTKTLDNYSVALRQWRAGHSHCQLLHGYALKFKLWFTSEELDEMNWIVDFGGFGHMGLKDWMNDMFDHTLLIEKDDPQLESFRWLQEMKLCKLVIMDKMGCESIAELVFNKFNDTLSKQEGGRCRVTKVEVFENDKNSAIYEG